MNIFARRRLANDLFTHCFSREKSDARESSVQ